MSMLGKEVAASIEIVAARTDRGGNIECGLMYRGVAISMVCMNMC